MLDRVILEDAPWLRMAPHIAATEGCAAIRAATPAVRRRGAVDHADGFALARIARGLGEVEQHLRRWNAKGFGHRILAAMADDPDARHPARQVNRSSARLGKANQPKATGYDVSAVFTYSEKIGTFFNQDTEKSMLFIIA